MIFLFSFFLRKETGRKEKELLLIYDWLCFISNRKKKINYLLSIVGLRRCSNADVTRRRRVSSIGDRRFSFWSRKKELSLYNFANFIRWSYMSRSRWMKIIICYINIDRIVAFIFFVKLNWIENIRRKVVFLLIFLQQLIRLYRNLNSMIAKNSVRVMLFHKQSVHFVWLSILLTVSFVVQFDIYSKYYKSKIKSKTKTTFDTLSNFQH